MNVESIRIAGLSRLDSLDLKKEYPEAEITFEPGATHDPQHGELVTIAVVRISLAGLFVLAAWLMKNRKSEYIEKSIETVDKDGTRRIEKIRIKVTESMGKADVVKALAQGLKIDLSKFQQGS